MKRREISCATLLALVTVSGCSQLTGGKLDLGTAISAGSDLYDAATVSDEQLNSIALQSAKEADSKNKLLKSGPYAARLTKLTKSLTNHDGMKLDFKVYQTSQINAFALPNGTVRVYSGLMDKMSDDELLFVIGHEIGHVKFGHSKQAMRLAYGASAARKGVASSNSVAGAVAASELGGLVEAVINAQFSQSEESESDRYGIEILKKQKRPLSAGPSALRKLAGGGSSGSSFLSSHPDPEDRAKALEELK